MTLGQQWLQQFWPKIYRSAVTWGALELTVAYTVTLNQIICRFHYWRTEVTWNNCRSPKPKCYVVFRQKPTKPRPPYLVCTFVNSQVARRGCFWRSPPKSWILLIKRLVLVGLIFFQVLWRGIIHRSPQTSMFSSKTATWMADWYLGYLTTSHGGNLAQVMHLPNKGVRA